MFDGLLNRALDDDDSTLGVIYTDDLPSRPTGYPTTPTFPTQSGSVPRFDQITSLINKGLDVVALFKTQNSIAQQNQIQALQQQQYRENPNNNSFGGGLDSAVNWIQNNLGTVAIIGVVWYALNMNPPSRRR